MVPHPSLALTASSLLLLPSVLAGGLYTKSSPVVQITGDSYSSLIAKSNHTSIVEFYAPWCGHCKNLQPAYEKAAKSLTGLAKVAAVNCDEETNKPFCGSMGVQGFPTLKIVRPNTKKVGGRPSVEDYQGPRTAKGIVDAVVEKIPNHVSRLKDSDYQAWLEKDDGPKAILFTDKGTVSATLKALAIDFLGSVGIAQIRDKEKQAVEVFNVDKFPKLVLLPGGEGKDPVAYGGEMKKEAMVAFLSQAASPNPDPAPKGEKKKASSSKSKSKTKSADPSKNSKASSSFSAASASHESEDSASARATQTSETASEPNTPPTASPDPQPTHEQPISIPEVAPQIPTLLEGLSLQQKCLNTKASTCILALLPGSGGSATSEDPATSQAILSLSSIHAKHSNRNIFPFYQLPTSNSQAASLRNLLSLPSDTLSIVATNGKRSWYRHYPKTTYTQAELEDWIDAIRMGDIPKTSMPANVIIDRADLPPEPVKVDWENMENVNEQLKQQMPEGVEFSMEEIDDVQYENMLRMTRESTEREEAAQAAAAAKAKEEHDEL